MVRDEVRMRDRVIADAFTCRDDGASLTGKLRAKLPVRKNVAGTFWALRVLSTLSTASAPEPPSKVSATTLLADLTAPQFVPPRPDGAG